MSEIYRVPIKKMNLKLLIGLCMWICLWIDLVVGNENSHHNGLPQLINADGSLTGHGGHQALETSHYNNYYPQPQQPYQGAGNFLSQASGELKQTAHNMADHLHNAGEALSNAPGNFVDNMNNMGHQISHGFENMLQNGLNKLNELKGQFSEKFRPLLDNAIQIFQTPRTEKEKWNEVIMNIKFYVYHYVLACSTC